MPTIRDVARSAEVSATTVSRVLNNDPSISVSEETRKRIFAAANTLGYKKKVVNRQIDSMALFYWFTEREELEDIYFKQMRLELEKQANARNISLMRYAKVDGIKSVAPVTSAFIAVGRFEKNERDYIHAITPNGVFVDSDPDESLFDSVCPNLALMVRQMVEYFISMGHKSIGFIGGKSYNIDQQPKRMDIREMSFRNTALEYSVFSESNIFIADSLSVSGGYKVAKQAISEYGDSLPTAFCVANDPLAIGALQAFNECGWKIPQRVSFFSINNVNVSKYVSPPLSTFDISIPTICETAFDLLEERLLKGRKLSKTVLIEGTPIYRKSVIRLGNA